MRDRNNVHLAIEFDGRWLITHFNLKEFENKKGWVMIHRSVIISLTKIREELGRYFGEEVEIVITDSTRTPEQLQVLGEKLGWIDEGGVVARNSKHLEEFGGIAVDFYVRFKQSKKRIDSSTIETICKKYFDYVKSDYADGHIHADNREHITNTCKK
ncbi:MAG: hypothetical protein ACP5UA_03240 [Candidatus Hydrogenedens sp.]